MAHGRALAAAHARLRQDRRSVTIAAMPLTLVPQGGNPAPASIGLRGTRVVIGKSASADLRLDHPSVEDEHAVVRPDGDGWVLEASGACSAGGVPIPKGQARLLQHGIGVRIGEIEIECTDLDTVQARRTVDLAIGAVRRAMRSSGPLDRWSVRVVQGPERGLVVPIESQTAIGRTKGSGVELTDPKVSREHAALRVADGVVQVRDLGAAQGTFLGTQRLEPGRWAIWKRTVALKVGDSVLVCVPPAIDAIEAHIDAAPLPTGNEPASKADASAVGEGPASEGEASPCSERPDLGGTQTEGTPKPEPIPQETRPAAAIAEVAIRPKKKMASLGLLVYAAAGLVLLVCASVLLWIFRG
jgi:pSer/pThr/pTyr-binding forkhead associated (FHA) protein